MLYLSCAEMGTMGDDSATVPVGHRRDHVIVNTKRVTHHAAVLGRTLDKVHDTLMVLQRLRLLDQIDLVLEDDEVLKLHDLDGGQVLGCLRLWTRLVRCYKQEGGIHDGGTVQHSSHENVVARAVDERDVPHKLHPAIAAWALAWWMVFFIGSV